MTKSIFLPWRLTVNGQVKVVPIKMVPIKMVDVFIIQTPRRYPFFHCNCINYTLHSFNYNF